ncbi:MAG: hypothetical protein PVJ01_05275, partial [Pseudomonadota bacterium]
WFKIQDPKSKKPLFMNPGEGPVNRSGSLSRIILNGHQFQANEYHAETQSKRVPFLDPGFEILDRSPP